MANHNPLCQRCKSEMILVREADRWWEFICPDPCNCCRVVSKPQSIGWAKEETKHRRADDKRRQLRALEARPKYFPLGKNK